MTSLGNQGIEMVEEEIGEPATVEHEEKNIEEEPIISEEVFDTNSLEILLQVTEIWDRMLRGEISEEEGKKLIESITSSIRRETSRRRRRRKKQR